MWILKSEQEVLRQSGLINGYFKGAFVLRFLREKGQGIVEYAVLLALISAVAVFVITGSGIKSEVTAAFVSTASVLHH